MKSTYILILFFNAGFSFSPQNDTAQAQVPNKAPIKSEKIIYFDVRDLRNERSYDFGKDVFLEYDSKGNLLKESIILADEDTKEETIHLSSLTHHQNGKRTKQENFSVLRGDIKKDEVIFTYQKDGKIAKEEVKAFENGKAVLNKNCLYTTYVHEKNETSDQFGFDEATRKFKLYFRTIKEFDARGNLIKMTFYDDQNEPYRLNQRLYNDKNQLIKEIIKDQYQDVEDLNTYNKEGDLLKTINKQGVETVYSYKYDAHLNWIEKTITSTSVANDKSAIITNYLLKRTLQYY